MKKKNKIVLPHMDGRNLDEATQAFTVKQLEYIRSKVYRKKYGKLKARTALPVSYDIPAWARTHTYNTYSHFGLMGLIESYADNLPVAGVAVEEVTAKVRAYGLAYAYSLDDLEASAKGSAPLNTEQAFACRRGWEELLEKVAWTGDSKAGLIGLLYQPNINVAQATTGGWSTATAQQIYDDLVQVPTTVFNATGGEEEINRIMIASQKYMFAKNKILYDNKTVLTVFKENYPEIDVDYLKALDNVTPRPSELGGSTNCMLGYHYDSEYIALEIPREFTQESPQAENLAYKVNTHGKTAGVTLRYPLSVVVVEGL